MKKLKLTSKKNSILQNITSNHPYSFPTVDKKAVGMMKDELS